MPYDNRDPKMDHNFDNHPYVEVSVEAAGFLMVRVSNFKITRAIDKAFFCMRVPKTGSPSTPKYLFYP